MQLQVHLTLLGDRMPAGQETCKNLRPLDLQDLMQLRQLNLLTWAYALPLQRKDAFKREQEVVLDLLPQLSTVYKGPSGH